MKLQINHIGNTIWRYVKNPEVSLTCREVPQTLTWTYCPHKDSKCTILRRISSATVCSYTAYTKVEGIRGKVFHYSGIKGLGFFLNAHLNCLNNGLTQLQNQQYDYGLQRISLTCHFLALKVMPKPVWHSGKNDGDVLRQVGLNPSAEWCRITSLNLRWKPSQAS